MKRKALTSWLLIMLSLVIMGVAGMQESTEQLVPKEINGWNYLPEDQKYNRETIFAYLDGGAELYLAYNMELLFSRKFTKENETDIAVDLFQMKSSNDAYGVFSH